jgi:hypothetical protein
MVVEYPVVPTGSARLRLQVLPSHTPEQAGQAAAAIAAAVSEARNRHRQPRRRFGPRPPRLTLKRPRISGLPESRGCGSGRPPGVSKCGM